MTFLTFLFAALTGAVFHWAKKRYRKQTLANLFDYLVVHYDATIRATAAVFAAAVGFYAATAELTGQNIAGAFTVGFMLDSIFNKAPEEK